MGHEHSVITLEVLPLIKHVHRVVLACFHVGAYQSFFGCKIYSPPLFPPTFEKVPILGGGRLPPGFFQLTEPWHIFVMPRPPILAGRIDLKTQGSVSWKNPGGSLPPKIGTFSKVGGNRGGIIFSPKKWLVRTYMETSQNNPVYMFNQC